MSHRSRAQPKPGTDDTSPIKPRPPPLPSTSRAERQRGGEVLPESAVAAHAVATAPARRPPHRTPPPHLARAASAAPHAAARHRTPPPPVRAPPHAPPPPPHAAAPPAVAHRPRRRLVPARPCTRWGSPSAPRAAPFFFLFLLLEFFRVFHLLDFRFFHLVYT